MLLNSHSENETRDFGKELAKKLNTKDVIALYGDLGSGKTQIVKGICSGLGVKEVVNSPTFIIVNEYSSEKIERIFHFDLYRMGTKEEVEAIGFDEYLQNGLCLIEWPEVIESLLPKNTKRIYLKQTEDENTREIKSEDV